jgi:hypothetical protein
MKILFISFLIVLLSLSLLLSLYFRKTKNQPQSFITQNHIKNPENFYWINRSDGSGLHDYGKDENYLVLSIKPFQTTACSDKVTCKELNSKCIDGVCVPYSNAEIYNGTCCDTFATLGDTNEVTTLFNVADKYRIALLKMVCEKQKSIGNCSLQYTPTITLDDPLSQTRQSILDTVINTPYRYSSVTQTVTCKNLKNGSRGFGFWNTSADLQNTSIAWFIQIDNGNVNDTSNGFYAQCQIPMKTKNFISFVKLPDLDENPHVYTVDWKKDKIDFIIDGKIVHTETVVLPSDKMAYHNWVDNSTFTYENGGLVHLIHKISSEKTNIIESIDIFTE